MDKRTSSYDSCRLTETTSKKLKVNWAHPSLQSLMTKEVEHARFLYRLRLWDRRQKTHGHTEFMVAYQTTGKHSVHILQNPLGCSESHLRHCISAEESCDERFGGKEGRSLTDFFLPWNAFCSWGAVQEHELRHVGSIGDQHHYPSKGKTHLDSSGSNQTTPKGDTFNRKRHQEETSRGKAATFWEIWNEVGLPRREVGIGKCSSQGMKNSVLTGLVCISVSAWWSAWLFWTCLFF